MVLGAHVLSAPAGVDAAHAQALAKLLGGALGRDPWAGDVMTERRGQSSTLPWAAAFIAGLGAMVGAGALYLALASAGALPLAALITFVATVVASRAYLAVVRRLRRRDDEDVLRDTFGIDGARGEG